MDCLAVFFLLDRLHTSVSAREPLVLAARLSNFPELFQRILHTSWLGPGLILAALLLITRPRAKSQKERRFVRIFHEPKLERYRGISPKRHKDLEV
jgi:hypothetical protein